MAVQKYNKAYKSTSRQFTVTARIPLFGVRLAYSTSRIQINHPDGYSHAIHINPYISEVWFDLGSLYESCNNQISGVIDASSYVHTSELDPSNHVVSRS
jgi:glucose repression mediator protein